MPSVTYPVETRYPDGWIASKYRTGEYDLIAQVLVTSRSTGRDRIVNVSDDGAYIMLTCDCPGWRYRRTCSHCMHVARCFHSVGWRGHPHDGLLYRPNANRVQ